MFKLSKIAVLNASCDGIIPRILDKMLREAGVSRIYRAGSADEVFAQVRQNQIDILLIDDNPPEFDGIDLTMEVRLGADSPDCYLPIVLLGRTSSVKRTVHAFEAGVHEVMMQPFPAKRLMSRISKCLANPPKFICSDEYFGPDRKSMKNGVLGDRRRMFEEKAAVQEQIDRISMVTEI